MTCSTWISRFSTDLLTLEIAFSSCSQAKENLTFNSSPSMCFRETSNRLIFSWIPLLTAHNFIPGMRFTNMHHKYIISYTHTNTHTYKRACNKHTSKYHHQRPTWIKCFYVRLQPVIFFIHKMVHDIPHPTKNEFNKSIA